MAKSNAKAPIDYAIWWYGKTTFDRESEQHRLHPDKIEIDLIQFLDWLYDNGFRYTKIYENGILFQIKNNRVLEEIEVAQVRQFVVEWIRNLPETITCNSRNGELEMEIPKGLLMEKVIKGVGYFFDTKRLEAYLGPKEVFKMAEDGPHEKFVYFKNGFLYINAKGIEFCQYEELPGYIWASEIVPHEFDIELAKDPKDQGHIKRFFQLVANGKAPEKQSQQDKINRAQRFADLCNIAGYLAHGYTKYKLKAVLLTDSRMSDTNEPNGRSGKTLFMKIVGGLITAEAKAGAKTYVEIHGKNFDPTDKHRYDKASHETRLVVLNDVKRYFKTEWLFNDITEGIEVNKKNQQPFMISAKMAVLSNLPIDMAGDSNADRFCLFEFSDYFNKNHDPQKEFGCWFFTGWDAVEWNRYYYFMAQCCQTFFADGRKLPQPEQINYARRSLVELIGRDLLAFIEEDWTPIPGEWYNVKDQFKRFTDLWPDNIKMKQKIFTERIQKYMSLVDKYKPFNAIDNSQRDSEGNRSIKFILENTLDD